MAYGLCWSPSCVETDHTRRQKTEAVLTRESYPVICSPFLSLRACPCCKKESVGWLLQISHQFRRVLTIGILLFKPCQSLHPPAPGHSLTHPSQNQTFLMSSPVQGSRLLWALDRDSDLSVFACRKLTSRGSVINHNPKPKTASVSRPRRQDPAWPMFRD